MRSLDWTDDSLGGKEASLRHPTVTIGRWITDCLCSLEISQHQLRGHSQTHKACVLALLPICHTKGCSEEPSLHWPKFQLGVMVVWLFMMCFYSQSCWFVYNVKGDSWVGLDLLIANMTTEFQFGCGKVKLNFTTLLNDCILAMSGKKHFSKKTGRRKNNPKENPPFLFLSFYKIYTEARILGIIFRSNLITQRSGRFSSHNMNSFWWPPRRITCIVSY